eukprot:TRINITY_DN12742_c0_g1_i1.p1 TRINITY_DN12742_c0_g1~~TRINITY_DN12742_c0_g1_i1.p1  ORF type:complete len:506 (-),score=36.95 TRINITY_DN12742_c0_g1_i1:395-1912(-)
MSEHSQRPRLSISKGTSHPTMDSRSMSFDTPRSHFQYLSEPGMAPVDLSAICRSGVTKGKAFRPPGRGTLSSEPRPRGMSNLSDYSAASGSLRETFTSGRNRSPSRSEPSRYLHEAGGPVADLSEITRPSIAKGGTFMSSHSDPKSPQHSPKYQSMPDMSTMSVSSEKSGQVLDLADITRPNLTKGKSFVGGRAKSPKPTGPSPSIYAEEFRSPVADLSQITRPGISKGGTYMRTGENAKPGHDTARARGLSVSSEDGNGILDLSSITRPGLTKGRTFTSGRSRSPMQTERSKYLHEPGGVIADLSAITRTGVAKGGTFVGSQQRSKQSPCSVGQIGSSVSSEAGGVLNLSEITRPNIAKGKAFVGGRSVSPRPVERSVYLQEAGGVIGDLSEIIRTGAAKGGTFMTSTDNSLKSTHLAWTEASTQPIVNLSEITRPGLAHGKTFVASSQERQSGMVWRDVLLGEQGSEAIDLNQITRSYLSQGKTFMPSYTLAPSFARTRTASY